MLRINVTNMIHANEGGIEEFSLSEKVDLEPTDGATLTKDVTIENIQLIRLPHEISVNFANLQSEVTVACDRCLLPYEMPISVEMTEREFIIDLPEEEVGDDDVFYIDKHTNTIDLYPMIREEILLHIPFIKVCSDGCKGLCSRCGANLNTTTCTCKPEGPLKHAFEKLLNS